MRQGLHVALSLTLGAALGAGFFAALVRSTPPPSQEPGRDESLAKAIAELSASVRALEEKVGALRIPAAPAPTSRTAAGGSPGPSEDLERTLRDLVGKLDALQSGTAGWVSAQPPLALQAAKPPVVAVLEAVRARSLAERTRDHAMWTFQEVLDRYGRPDGVDLYGGEPPTIRWTYNLPENRLLRFKFFQGYVLWVSDEGQKF